MQEHLDDINADKLVFLPSNFYRVKDDLDVSYATYLLDLNHFLAGDTVGWPARSNFSLFFILATPVLRERTLAFCSQCYAQSLKTIDFQLVLQRFREGGSMAACFHVMQRPSSIQADFSLCP